MHIFLSDLWFSKRSWLKSAEGNCNNDNRGSVATENIEEIKSYRYEGWMVVRRWEPCMRERVLLVVKSFINFENSNCDMALTTKLHEQGNSEQAGGGYEWELGNWSRGRWQDLESAEIWPERVKCSKTKPRLSADWAVLARGVVV